MPIDYNAPAELFLAKRFNSSQIQRLYEANDYPLRKPE